MRILSVLTSSVFLLLLHELTSVWFLVDFFLARDSSTVHNIRKSQNTNTSGTKFISSTTNRQRNIIDNISSDLRGQHCRSARDLSEPVFDKIVLIVIDALGSDFIPSLNEKYASQSSPTMPFVEQMLKEQKGMGFKAKAATPTVTMPRIKALVSGAIPSFVDIIYNLAKDVSAVSDHDDNILRIAKSRGKSLVFYGDDTWLSLFERDMFLRYRETLSLFASDYTSVDTNVTEMALPETRRDLIDWDYLILHYLGLDHIGHSFGSNTDPMINKKLLEMDDIVREIYNNMSKKNHKTLIVICGDHGMSREGNHGGDSDLEANTAMIFLPLNVKYNLRGPNNSDILQIDLATTISHLTGLPSPRMSMGIPVQSLIEGLFQSSESSKRLLCVALDTLVHLVDLIGDELLESGAENDSLVSKTIELLNEHIILSDNIATDKLMIEKYFRLAKKVQQQLIVTIAAKSSQMLISASLIFAIILTLVNLRKSCIKLHMPLMLPKEKILCLTVTIVPIIMQASTDYIELEHNYRPVYSLVVFVGFLLVALGTRNRAQIIEDIDRPRIVFFFVAFATHYLWNNIHYFRASDGGGWFATILSLCILCNFSKQISDLSNGFPRMATVIFYFFGLTVFYTKTFEDSPERTLSIDDAQAPILSVASMQILCLILLVSLTFINIWLLCAHGCFQVTLLVQKLATSWMWFAFLLSRSRNFPFLVSNVILEVSVNSIANTFQLSAMSRCLIYLQFAASSFYNQGNTNLFTSIDVKPAFFGQTQYNFLLAAPLVACATYSSQIYWYMKLFQRVQSDKEQERMRINGGGSAVGHQISELRTGVRDFIDMQNYLTLAFYMFVCIVLRNHLFVWSVLSPKLVYHWMGTMVVLRLTTLTISAIPSLALSYFVMRNESEKHRKQKSLIV